MASAPQSRQYTVPHSQGTDQFHFDASGRRHRIGGPAVTYRSGTYWREEYWSSGRRHRLDGPAVIDSCGYTELWRDGVMVVDTPKPDPQVLRLASREPVRGYGTGYTNYHHTPYHNVHHNLHHYPPRYQYPRYTNDWWN